MSSTEGTGGRGHTPARPAWPARAAAAASRRTRRTCRTRRARPLAPSRRWRRRWLPRRLGDDSSARRHELWPSPKGQLTAGIGQLPSACGRLAAPSGRLGPSLVRPAAVHSTRSASAHGTRGIGIELQVHIVAPLVQCSRPMGAACGRRTARDALCELLRRRRRCWWRRGDRRRAGLATRCLMQQTSADLAGCSLDQQRVGSACVRTVAWRACGRAGVAIGPRRRAHGSEASAPSSGGERAACAFLSLLTSG